jgi:hypothetical protein
MAAISESKARSCLTERKLLDLSSEASGRANSVRRPMNAAGREQEVYENDFHLQIDRAKAAQSRID